MQISEIGIRFDSPVVIAAEEIRSKRLALVAAVESGEVSDPVLVEGYVLANGVLQDQFAKAAEDVLNSEEIQSVVSTESQRLQKALAQLEPLKDILSREQIAATEEPIREQAAALNVFADRYGFKIEFLQEQVLPNKPEVNQAGGLAQTEPRDESIEPKPKSAEAAPEQETVKQEVGLTFYDKFVKVGLNGKRVKYDLRSGHRGDQADYSEVRKAALAYIIEHQDEPIRPQDIAKAITEEGRVFTGKERAAMIRFFDTLTYNGKPIVASEGVKGGKKYVVNPEIQLFAVHKSKSTPGLLSQVMPHKVDLDTGVVDPPSATTAPQPERSIGGLDKGALYVTAVKLREFRTQMAVMGLPVVSDEMLVALKQYCPDLSHLTTDAQKFAYREQQIQHIQQLITDEEKLDDLLNEIEVDTPEGQFVFEIIAALENDEDRVLLSRLFRAKLIHKPVLGKDGAVTLIETIVDGFETPIWPLSDGVFPNSRSVGKPAPRKNPQNQQDAPKPTQRPDSKPDAKPKASARAQKETTVAVKQKKVEKKLEPRLYLDNISGEWRPDRRKPDSKRRADLDKLEDRARVVASTYLKQLSPNKAYAIGTIHQVIGGFTATMVDRAREKGIGMSTGEPGRAALKDVVHMMVWDTASVSTVYGQKTNKKHVERIIDKVIDDSIAKSKATEAQTGKSKPRMH